MVFCRSVTPSVSSNIGLSLAWIHEIGLSEIQAPRGLIGRYFMENAGDCEQYLVCLKRVSAGNSSTKSLANLLSSWTDALNWT